MQFQDRASELLLAGKIADPDWPENFGISPRCNAD
jgi:hypothetical protein